MCKTAIKYWTVIICVWFSLYFAVIFNTLWPIFLVYVHELKSWLKICFEPFLIVIVFNINYQFVIAIPYLVIYIRIILYVSVDTCISSNTNAETRCIITLVTCTVLTRMHVCWIPADILLHAPPSWFSDIRQLYWLCIPASVINVPPSIQTDDIFSWQVHWLK